MSETAHFIIENARIFTSDPLNPHAEAVAVRGNRILYVGTNEGAQSFKDNSTRVIDGQGRTLTPGLIDSHVHLLSGSIWMGNAQLQSVKTREDLKKTLSDFADKNRTDPWVVGRGIKYGIVSTRHELDEILAERPVYIGAYDGHTGWANTRALEMAGILHHDGRERVNGIIVRDESGLATGELREDDAMHAVMDLVPVPDANRKRELLKIAIAEFNKTGITSVHNMNGDMEELMTYAALEDAGEMNLRVYVPYHVKPETTEEMLSEAGEMVKVQMDYVRGGAAKFFMDGVWESHTAFNIDPYADEPDVNVKPIFSSEHFIRMASLCDQVGLQIAVHCCGDGAVRQALDGFDAIRSLNGERDSRHRVEHIEVCQPEDMSRFKELGVIASMQTSHAPLTLEEDPVWTSRTGAQRWPISFPWRSLKNAGAHLALGSDWTVAPFDPMINIYVALNRQKWAPDDPDQRLTLEECILGYTRDAAYTEFREYEKGQIKEGYLADLVLFSHDLFKVPPEEIGAARAVMTMIDGRIVHEAETGSPGT
ncbi:MAG TPA: amidohydrolase [Anaerolineales bacterium]|nr:amidohydrolase [Anaerolineales bacterium]